MTGMPFSWMRRPRTLRALFPVLALLLVGSAKKEPAATVRFYAESNSQSGENFTIPVMLQYPPRKAFLDKIPVISERNVESILPSMAADGSMRCVFKLDPGGTQKLDSVSVEKRGTSLVAVVNGRQVTDMLIDQRVSDGIIMIPGGLSDPDIRSLVKKFPVMRPREKRDEMGTSAPHFRE